MNDAPTLIDIALLDPHPANPRVVEREDVIAAIEQQIREAGFDASHAILVRPVGGRYQIVSGHNRTAAARRVGLTQVPAWVREMDDDTAFMQLVLANAQGELSPLERGLHALAATEKHGDIKGYAEATGRPRPSVQAEVQAARVAKSCTCNFSELLDRTRHLSDIHAAPRHCWPALVKRMVEGRWTVEETKAMVNVVATAKPPRGYESLFPVDRLQELVARGEDANELIKYSVRTIERARADMRDAQFDSDEFVARFDEWLAEHGPWDTKAMAAHAHDLIEEQRAARRAAEAKVAKLKRAVMLTEWQSMSGAERQALLAVRNAKAKLTRQDKESSIEWARWSWNPVTGCRHNCAYCYARDIAERFYPQKFEPSLVPDALAAPLNAAPPKEAADDVGWKNIFTCSMADLFGNWVPAEWIEAVLAVVREAREWNFLMLTKFAQRLAEFEFPDNVWLGATIDSQARVTATERAMVNARAAVKWVSIEPMLDPIAMDFSIFQWVVVGGASASSQTPEWKPPRKWVIDLTAHAMAAGCAVYHKTNLNLERLRDYPGFTAPEPSEPPTEFHHPAR
jgi:ParB/RepB/Spo0J family partition protein